MKGWERICKAMGQLGSQQAFAGVPVLEVSIRMRLENHQRLDQLARQLEAPGDALVDLALREWLDNHEADLLAGRVRLLRETG